MADKGKNRVLFIDDEPGVLRALKRAYRQESFTIICTTTPIEALRYIEREDISVVVSDYNMPKMNGVDLLHKIKEKNPTIKKILLTGQADTDAVIAAVNESGIHKYFVKPWCNKALLKSIYDCIQLHEEELKQIQLTQKLKGENNTLSIKNSDLESQFSRAIQRLESSKNYDPISALPNEYYLTHKIDEVLIQLSSRKKDDHSQFALIAIGFNSYDTIEDTLGFKKTSKLINELSGLLKQHIRSDDCLAKVRQNVFILAGRFDSDDMSIYTFARQLLDTTQSFDIQNSENLRLFLSAGISILHTHAHNSQELIEHAMIAMHQARHQQPVSVSFYDHSKRQHFSSKMVATNDLYKALENNEFYLEFQPRVEMSTDKIIAAEALIRWNRKGHGIVPPSEFIPLLESTDIIYDVGNWCIQQAFQVSKKLSEQGTPLIIAVNISPQHFQQGNLHHTISRMAVDTNLPPADFLEIEITENTMTHDIAKTCETMQQLRHLGVRIAIDDFGTGYSSFNYLARLPVDYLKIDRSFVAPIEKERCQSIVKSIISIAEALDLRVIAEGVEYRHQAEILQALGCHEIQGYYYSLPLSMDQFLSMAEFGCYHPQAAHAG